MYGFRPTGGYAAWASGGSGVGGITDPTQAQKNFGWSSNTSPPAAYFNWKFNKDYQWQKFLDDNTVFVDGHRAASSLTISATGITGLGATGHIVTAGAPPTVTYDVGAGASPASVGIVGNDICGTIFFTAAGSPAPTLGKVFSVTLRNPKSGEVYITCVQSNANNAALPMGIVTQDTANGWDLYTRMTALSATTYNVQYHCIAYR